MAFGPADLVSPVTAYAAQVYDEYFLPSIRGQLFHGCTAATGLAIAAAGTAQAFVLYNPPGNSKNVAISQVSILPVSGTFVLGGIAHAVSTNPLAALATGTAAVPIPGVTGGKAAPTAQLLTTATLAAAPTICRVFAAKNATASTGTPLFGFTDFVNGSIVLPPGCSWNLIMVGTDTTPIWVQYVMWQEI